MGTLEYSQQMMWPGKLTGQLPSDFGGRLGVQPKQTHEHSTGGSSRAREEDIRADAHSILSGAGAHDNIL